ncbi:hypothetical protein GCM10029963_28970 [Micromonospora andamanensis]
MDDETSALTILRDAGWAVAPGALYRLAGPPGLRLTVSDLHEQEIPTLADAVARAARPAPAPGFTA